MRSLIPHLPHETITCYCLQFTPFKFTSFQLCIMAVVIQKKRKLNDPTRVFNDSCSEEYFFVCVKGKPVCLICNESVSVRNHYNLKTNYTTKHATYEALSGQEREDKLEVLRKAFDAQQNVFRNQNTDVENVVRASYAVSKLIGKKLMPFTDGEFIKECMLVVAEVVCPEQGWRQGGQRG